VGVGHGLVDTLLVHPDNAGGMVIYGHILKRLQTFYSGVKWGERSLIKANKKRAACMAAPKRQSNYRI
jgi:hypothetical protein